MKKKILAICGSMAFADEMEGLAETLESERLTVKTPTREEGDLDWSNLSAKDAIKIKRGYIDDHLNLIRESDAVLIANYTKHGVSGYVGPNSLMEAAFGYAMQIPVFVLYPIGAQGCKLELESIVSKIFEGHVHPASFG